MRTYVAITGVLFGLITLAHIWRVVEESSQLAMDPFFIATTLASAGLCIWAVRLLRLRARS